MEENGGVYGFLEGNVVNSTGLGLMGYYWFLEIENNGFFKTKIWGKESPSRLKGKRGMRGKFSGDGNWLILSSIFKNDEWKGKQKLLKISDNELVDVAISREYTSFRILDIWGSHVFISDENEKLSICEIEVE